MVAERECDDQSGGVQRQTAGPVRHTRFRRRVAAGAAIAVLALCTLAPAFPTLAAVAIAGLPSAAPRPPDASAQQPPGPFGGRYSDPLASPLASPMSAAVALSYHEQARITAYWSRERRTLAQAAGATGWAGHPAQPGAGAAALTPQGLTATSPPPPSTGSAYDHGGAVTRTVGRLFTTIAGVDYACSATVVSSPGLDMAVTAGHCLHGGTDSVFADNVAFMPGYDSGSLPYGLWTARRITVTPDWGRRGDFDFDTGFVLFNTRDGRHLQEVVGAEKIAFNQPRTLAQYAFGYPRLGHYDGEQMIYCAGAPAGDPYGTASLGLRCDMTGGASGGPLLVGLGRAGPGAGWVDSVISYAYSGDPDTIYGTYFGRAIELLYYQSAEL